MKTTITMVVLIGLLVLGSFVGWGLLTEEVPTISSDPSSEPTCRNEEFKGGAKLFRNQVTVNVHNAGTVAGLADETLVELVNRGFIGGRAENAPDAVQVQNVVVMDPAPLSAEARLVRAQFRGVVHLRKPPKRDLEPGIDVVVGDGFLGLKDRAIKSIRVKGSTTVCVPVNDPDA